MTNTTTARFLNNSRCAVTAALWQYDYGQMLEIDGLELPSTFEVHFCNDGDATTKTQLGSEGTVTIPDEYLTTGKNIFVYIYLHTGENDGETEYTITIPVRRRAQPSDEEPTPEQQSALTEAIAALNAATAQLQAATERMNELAASIWSVELTEAGILKFTKGENVNE